MILSDRDIKAYIKEGKLIIAPMDDPKRQIQPSSIDLRLGNTFLHFKVEGRAFIDPTKDSLQDLMGTIEVEDGKPFFLRPGEFVLGTTIETIKLPEDLVARVDGRSSLGRLGVIVHATAGYVDPGFCGQITLELSNINHVPIALYPGMRICQISFYTLTSPAETPYYKKEGSKYQNQKGPTASKLDIDFCKKEE
ncbi:MAG TPA: dCTP deaminase [Dictyoglomaceae bacterium]|nr:dCTP deaminase [Dictyoglomaceae bacterium]HPP16265.1 dCTP deaminase [Dictyoglomaceae bacterium]HPU43988.1 dCTP deaminase [Dictyoglomaceae bacterium]